MPIISVASQVQNNIGKVTFVLEHPVSKRILRTLAF
jgi:hypothetical protein